MMHYRVFSGHGSDRATAFSEAFKVLDGWLDFCSLPVESISPQCYRSDDTFFASVVVTFGAGVYDIGVAPW